MSKYKSKLLSLQRNQYILYIMVLTLVLAMLWMLIEVVTSQRVSGVDPDIRSAASPLNPNLDAQVLARIARKKVYAENELADFPIYMIKLSDDGATESIIPISFEELETGSQEFESSAQEIGDEDESGELGELGEPSQPRISNGDDTVPEPTPAPVSDPGLESNSAVDSDSPAIPGETVLPVTPMGSQ